MRDEKRNILGNDFMRVFYSENEPPTDWECELEGCDTEYRMSVFFDSASNGWGWELCYLFSEYEYERYGNATSWEPFRNSRSKGFQKESDALFDAARTIERWKIVDAQEKHYWEMLDYASYAEQINMILQGD